MYYIAIEFRGEWDIAQPVLREQHPVNIRSYTCSCRAAHVAVSELDATPFYIQLRTRVARLLKQIPRLERDATTPFVLAHWFDVKLVCRSAMLPSQRRATVRRLITRELRIVQRVVNEERWADEEMRIALRRRGAGSTVERGWLVPSNDADARAMLEGIRANVL